MKNVDFKTYSQSFPTKDGYFGKYGGNYTPDELRKPLEDIAYSYQVIGKSEKFKKELREIQKHFQGRPTPIYYCKKLTNLLGGKLHIYLKREDLNHTGSHKLNHCMGEALLAKYMGKKKLIAETGAGQHGVAIATAAAYFDLECEVHMGEIDIAKQAQNVSKMKLLGAKVIPVSRGGKTLKEAVDSSFEAYLKDYENSMYCIGSVVGPHPFPLMVRDFQKVVGIEAREQFLELNNSLPNKVIACVGGGSNSIGIFHGFLEDDVELIGIEPLGKGNKKGEHAATIQFGSEGVIHGFKSIVLQDENGNPDPVYSIASGLDYPSVGPEHSLLNDIKRVSYKVINDSEALEAFTLLSKNEGIIPALESAHALAYAIKLARGFEEGSVLVNLSGRGDKDVDFIINNYLKL